MKTYKYRAEYLKTPINLDTLNSYGRVGYQLKAVINRTAEGGKIHYIFEKEVDSD
jgi:hypothetical protein